MSEETRGGPCWSLCGQGTGSLVGTFPGTSLFLLGGMPNTAFLELRFLPEASAPLCVQHRAGQFASMLGGRYKKGCAELRLTMDSHGSRKE